MKAVSRPPQTIFVPRKPKLQISTLNVLYSRTPIRPSNASIKSPPADFDFRSSEVVVLSRSAIADSHPELLDLADRGSLVLVQKRQFGRVPSWRAEFVEPEEIWVMGTTHISQASSVDVERVGRALRPDNVVVELCRSRTIGRLISSHLHSHSAAHLVSRCHLTGVTYRTSQ